jgi:cobalt-zinc-cadmium efflux system outer membrane protein
MPGQRTASRGLVQAERAHLERKWLASRLRLAALVREAWWTWQGAHADAALANDQWTSARRLAADVARRTQAGDLARADQHQAEGAVAAAEAFAAQAQATASSALAALVALTGDFTLMHAGNAAPHQAPLIHQATLNEPTPVAAPIEDHPLLVELKDRLAIAEATIQLVKTQTRANPELKFSASRSRESSAERDGQTKVLIGIRLPLQAGPRHDARLAAALAEALEVQSQWRLERDRILADQHAAQARLQSAQAQVEAARRRARLAKESLAFFDKSFRLGETGLPQRLRIEAEAAEAQRQEARSQIALAAALSAWRQALGLLPQ